LSEHRIVVATPAGRRHYLEILKTYVLADPEVAEWHLWDNCRNPKDREYIQTLEQYDSRIKVVHLDTTDGTNRSLNRFYPFCADPGTFFIKMDDDLVYLQPGLAGALYRKALAERPKYLWWSPLVVNNAVCSWLLKHHARVDIRENLSCQAGDNIGWRSPEFAKNLHQLFLGALCDNRLDDFRVGDF
jgi:hypothetical protein